jgi:hypothetical protein
LKEIIAQWMGKGKGYGASDGKILGTIGRRHNGISEPQQALNSKAVKLHTFLLPKIVPKSS